MNALESSSMIERAIARAVAADLKADEARADVASIKEALDKVPTIWQLRAYILGAVIASRFVPIEDVASALPFG